MNTQEEINDAVMLILQNTEEMTTDALEKLSFALWVEQQIRELKEEV